MKYHLIISFNLLFASVYGQVDSTKLNIKQVEVVKSFEANLEQANIVVVKPVSPAQKVFNPKYEYDISIVPLELKAPDPQIKPLAMNPDGPFLVKKGFLHAGYGIKKNPEILGGYHWSKKDNYDAGIVLNYQSLDNSANVPYQKYSDVGIDLHGNYLIRENLKVYGGISTDWKKRYFFHTDLGVDTLYDEDASLRKIQALNITAGIANPEPTAYNINYDVKLNLRNLTLSNTDAKENGFGIDAMGEKHFTKSTVLAVQAGYDYTAFNNEKSFSLSTALFRPTLKTKIKNVILQGGAHLLYSSDGNSSIFPEIYASYGLAGQKLMIFAQISQNYYTNHFANVTKLNPFLNTAIDSLQNSIWQEYAGGIKGKFSFINYQIRSGYKDVKNHLFLLNNTHDIRQFDMLYDDLGIIFISGNVDFIFSDALSLGGWLTQNIYNLNIMPYAWHTPNLEANAYATWSLLDQKLKLRGDVYFGDGVRYIDKDNFLTKSNILFDVNFRAEYKVLDALSVYIHGMNILNNRYERWYGYQAVGFNAQFGVKLVF